jgi:hypothetical protein
MKRVSIEQKLARYEFKEMAVISSIVLYSYLAVNVSIINRFKREISYSIALDGFVFHFS